MQNGRKSIPAVRGIENGWIFWFIDLELGDNGKITRWFLDQDRNNVIGSRLVLVYQSCSMRGYVYWLSNLPFMVGIYGCDCACVPIEWLHAVAQLVEALRYKPEGRGFDFPWYQWDVPLPSLFRPQYDPGVGSAPNRNEYQGYLLGSKGSRCVGVTTLPLSCADCL